MIQTVSRPCINEYRLTPLLSEVFNGQFAIRTGKTASNGNGNGNIHIQPRFSSSKELIKLQWYLQSGQLTTKI